MILNFDHKMKTLILIYDFARNKHFKEKTQNEHQF